MRTSMDTRGTHRGRAEIYRYRPIGMMSPICLLVAFDKDRYLYEALQFQVPATVTASITAKTTAYH